MKIAKIKIKNYRLLKEFEIDLEDVLSLVIGKNNCGKTSFLSLLERFLHTDLNKFSFEDLNIESQQELKNRIETSDNTNAYKDIGISLQIFINYDEKDNLSNISSIMLDLNPDIKTVILSFEYLLDEEREQVLIHDYTKFKEQIDKDLSKKFETEKTDSEKQKIIKVETHRKKDIIFFLKKYHNNYFQSVKRALEFNNEDNFIDLSDDKKLLDKIINFKRIKAKREVANEDGTSKKSDKTLSKMSSKYYDKISKAESESETITQLQNELSETDDKLNVVYDTLFSGVIGKIRKFGGLKKDESLLKIISSLEERNILSNNTTVMYEHIINHSLPEDYNGLGYMNLIAMIFEIEVLLNDFKKKGLRNEVPADINLLFIEEPEAHTHPQMQYVFIKNIKEILEGASKGIEDGITFNLQSIITTHSSCITAESDFDDIKYFFRDSINSVVVKNLKDLKGEYAAEDPKDYNFLKRYLTLNRTELFFADKAVFIEGDTERLLLPAMMKKIDKEDKTNSTIPLLSQNISIVEVGAYSHIFEKFINFLGIKTLILTDLDSVDENKKKCRVSDGKGTSNAALNFFFSKMTFHDLKSLANKDRILSKDSKNIWAKNEAGVLCICYQKEESNYHSRSFEDAFIQLNRKFIGKNKDVFQSLKNRSNFDDNTKDSFHLADECIDKKTLFALDILFFSDEEFTNWDIPYYIKEGLLWLKN